MWQREFVSLSLLAKTDLENAYKQVPIHPDDFELLGFQINNEFYCDKTLPFGLSYSCNLFEKFSSSLQWILENKFDVQYCVHILDDFLFVGPPNSPECAKALQSFRTLAQDINIPIQEEKTVSPTTVLTFLGIEIDTVKCEVRLPEDKLTSLKEVLSRFMCKRTATLQELQSLIGLLNFACAVVPRGRTFLRRIINLTRGIQKPHHHRNLDKESRADLKAWSIFIDKFNGRAFFPSGVEHTSHTPCIFLQMLVIWAMGEFLGLNGSMVLLQNIGLTTTYQCENFYQLLLLWKCGGLLYQTHP